MNSSTEILFLADKGDKEAVAKLVQMTFEPIVSHLLKNGIKVDQKILLDIYKTALKRINEYKLGKDISDWIMSLEFIQKTLSKAPNGERQPDVNKEQLIQELQKPYIVKKIMGKVLVGVVLMVLAVFIYSSLQTDFKKETIFSPAKPVSEKVMNKVLYHFFAENMYSPSLIEVEQEIEPFETSDVSRDLLELLKGSGAMPKEQENVIVEAPTPIPTEVEKNPADNKEEATEQIQSIPPKELFRDIKIMPDLFNPYVTYPKVEIKKEEVEQIAIQEETDDDDDDKNEPIILDVKTMPTKGFDSDVIKIGDGEVQRKPEDFKDQEVEFFAFMEVKNMEKAKEKILEILDRYGYKGEVKQSNEKYILLTSTFPGKKKHDKMIRRFASVGQLYIGNDVSEFLELYKQDFDKNERKFFRKYKPEDLPKEVTVNLYVVTKMEKE